MIALFILIRFKAGSMEETLHMKKIAEVGVMVQQELHCQDLSWRQKDFPIKQW